jgi:hypothetical protein
MAQGFIQLQTEMGITYLPGERDGGGEVRPAHKVDNLTSICEPIAFFIVQYEII